MESFLLLLGSQKNKLQTSGLTAETHSMTHLTRHNYDILFGMTPSETQFPNDLNVSSLILPNIFVYITKQQFYCKQGDLVHQGVCAELQP